MARTVGKRGGYLFVARRGRWISGVLAVVGTFLLAYALSPGLRAGLGGIAALVGGVDAAG